MSRVPTSRGGLVAMASLAAWICVPGFALVALIGAEGSRVARLALLLSVWLLAVLGIASCVRRILDTLRWRGFGGRGIVVTNVAVDTRGVGLGRGLLGEIARAADEVGCTLLLSVRTANFSAVGLYRSLGFENDPSVPVRTGQLAMVRPPARAAGPGAVGLADSPVAGLIVAGWLGVTSYVLAAATSMPWPIRIAVVCGLMLMCLAALVDMRTHRLPNRFVVGAAAFAGLATYLAGSVESALIAAGMGSAPLLFVHLIEPSALGFGDVKFAAVAGALVATWWWPAAIVMVLGTLGFAGVGRLIRPSGPLAFGPSLFAGTLTAVVSSIVLVERGFIT